MLSQSVGYLAIQASLPRLPAVITSVLLLVQPVTTVILGAILLAELPSPWQLAGVALVLFGIALATGAGCGGSLARTRDGLTGLAVGAGPGPADWVPRPPRSRRRSIVTVAPRPAPAGPPG